MGILGQDEKAHAYPFQISTGSIGLDLAIGPVRRDDQSRWHTGVPAGRMIEIFGGESCGKTAMALHMVANAQRKLKWTGLLAGYVASSTPWTRSTPATASASTGLCKKSKHPVLIGTSAFPVRVSHARASEVQPFFCFTPRSTRALPGSCTVRLPRS